MRRRSAVFALAAPLAVSACFLGYDSRWGEAKRAQQRLAAQSGPASVTSPTESALPPGAAHHTWRVRVRPDGQYLAQNMDAPRRVRELLEDAGRVLVPSVGLELVLDRVEPWTLDADDRPDDAMSALQRDDPGTDVDLVVGMIGALPRQTDALHEEGRATLLGKHVVVRGPSRAGEHDAVGVTFGELSEDERARMLKLRQHHRALATLLHEVGHCLGAIHETEANSLMAPAYSPTMSGFGGGAIALMRAALSSSDATTVAKAQLELLENASGASWVAADREAEAARLQAMVSPQLVVRPRGGGAAPASTVAAGAIPDAPPELDADARGRFLRARELLQTGGVRKAYDTAKPLFTAYPAVLGVQDLRCQLAAVRWLPREQMMTECAPFARLTADAGATGPGAH